MYREEYDERQLKIRSDVYQHGWIFTVLLMLINWFLGDFQDFVWAQPGNMFAVLGMASIAFVSIEMILRDVYVGRDSWRLYIIPFCLLAFGIWSFYLCWAERDQFVTDGMLTRAGTSVVMAVLFMLTGIVGVYKFIRNRRAARHEAEDE
jgi:hypothetical protein